MVGQLHCPLFGVFGEEDQNPPVELEAELKKRAQAAGKDVSTKVYKNAGHAFLADYRPSYREPAAKELWADATAFLEAPEVSPHPNPPPLAGEGGFISPLLPSEPSPASGGGQGGGFSSA